ncbi:MAG: cytochrome c [Undibacterium sp.]|nr:cytochrome c [Undibacterium sp.]
MSSRIRSIVFGFIAVLCVLLVVLFLIAQWRWDRHFPVPSMTIHASTDAKLIERGRYLAYGPAHCVHCHVTVVDGKKMDGFAAPTLAGGRAFVIPPGTIYAPNITPDPVTGIGTRSDAQLAQFIRYGIHADGRAAIPFMNFQNLSDEDLLALVSFLRSQEAVNHPVPKHEINLLGKLVLALIIKPTSPTPSVSVKETDTALLRGAYLTNVVAQCATCHTKRNLVDGSFTGPRLAGGMEMESEVNSKWVFVTPNLTPDKATGRIVTWSREEFIARFRTGEIIPHSHMPWRSFSTMTDGDLADIYAYLQSIPAVQFDPGSPLREKN